MRLHDMITRQNIIKPSLPLIICLHTSYSCLILLYRKSNSGTLFNTTPEITILRKGIGEN